MLQYIAYFNNTIMGKKIKNPKLLKSKPASNPIKSAFNSYAKEVQRKRQKKMEKRQDTKNRMMNQKRSNQKIRLPAGNKKINKFALIDDQTEGGGLTHNGITVKEMNNFNDVEFGIEDEEDYGGEEYEDLNFDDGSKKIKQKKDIYKQIIEKSKQHKRERQEQYEQNYNKAVELDEEYLSFVGNLNFLDPSSRLKQRMKAKKQKATKEYDKLMDELKNDEVVVPNKVFENTNKGRERMKRKKNQQINQLMNQSDDSNEDIRGWVEDISEQNDEEDEEEDEIDDVQLSSEEQSEQQEEQDEQEAESEDDEQEWGDQGEGYEDEQDLQEEGIEIVEESSSPVKKIENTGRKKKK